MSARARSPVSAAEAERLARAVLRAARVNAAVLSVTFVGRHRMRALNRRHFGRDRETDVIALELTGGARAPRPELPLVGDVYVCAAVGVAQARRFGATERDEVRRLVVHGALHALGHDHPDGPARTSSAMWRLQERILARFARGTPRRRSRSRRP